MISAVALSNSSWGVDWAPFDVGNGLYATLVETTVAANGQLSCTVEIDKTEVKTPWLPSFSMSVSDGNGKAFTVYSSTEEVGQRLFGIKVSEGDEVNYQSNFLGMLGVHNRFSLELYWWDTGSAAFRANAENGEFGQGMMQNVGFTAKEIKIYASSIKGRARCSPEIQGKDGRH